MDSEPTNSQTPAASPGDLVPPREKAKSGLVTIIVILGVITIANAGWLWQTNIAVDSTRSDVATLQNSVSLASSAAQAGGDLASLAQQIQPTVVYVADSIGSGSGVIIGANGYVITNQHVIDQATGITVTLMNGSSYSASVVNSNADLDVAVLKMNTTLTNLPVAAIGSSAAVLPGEEVLTCGFPLGSDLPGSSTFTAGIISAIRNRPSINTSTTRHPSSVTLNYIQIDADINPGNSGGGLFTADGKLVGIPAYSDATGVNFAVPIDAASSLIKSALG